MRIAGKVAAAVTALGVAVVIADMHQTARARRAYLEASEELFALRAALNAEVTHADVKRWAHQTRHLEVLDAGTHVAVETPFAASTPQAILWLEYRDEPLCSASLWTYDENRTRIGGSPPDLTFACEMNGPLQNNKMQQTSQG